MLLRIILIVILIRTAVPAAIQSSVITISVESDVSDLKCVYKEVSYIEGEVFKDGTCKKCRCEGGVIICQEIRCPVIDTCQDVYIPEGECCPVCSDRRNKTISLIEYCIHNTQLYEIGAKWQSDTCTECVCDTDSVARCRAKECGTNLPCWEIEDKDQCCPVCKVSACRTDNGLKREGDIWLEGDQVVACRNHLLTPIDCQLSCSNDPTSMECTMCKSIEYTAVLHTCGYRNLTFHETQECVSIRPLSLVTNNCPQECSNRNNEVLCCQPKIREKLIKHTCGNHGNRLITVPIVTKCFCNRC
ncbi:hypothetical protein LOD99_3039 [Oopsacas minuta]|uniref:VWFC domain-containing protein n=1 Tax=Oopsacas minuta TaxID=111878 RepID=A0AAV7JZF9_9METZ|nr:hypothetical protein LOD99_3039 [Oopsacas minuta]